MAYEGEKGDQGGPAGKESDPVRGLQRLQADHERNDNWREVFKPIFLRAEDVRESFQRLFSIRIATMHARVITMDDETLLRFETTRVLKAIRTAAGRSSPVNH